MTKRASRPQEWELKQQSQELLKIGWTPSLKQRLLLRCPVFELLAWGNRGGGKSDWLLMDFAQDIGRGYGRDWRGIILRREYKDLADIVERSKKWFPLLFPGAIFRGSADTLDWTFPTGERLSFQHAKRDSDIRRFVGQEWPWQGWDELCNWPQPDLYFDVQSCARSSNPEVRVRIRAATNSWGPGAWWVKEYFIDPVRHGRIFREERSVGAGEHMVTHAVSRTHVRMDFRDNAVLSDADPTYLNRLRPSDPAKRAAWIESTWNLSVGGFFSGVWDTETHVLEPFQVPSHWRIDRAHDLGSQQSALHAVVC